MVKIVGYYMFALVFYLCRLLPVDSKRVFCIMTHDDGKDSNVGLVIRGLKKLKAGYGFRYITKAETGSVKGFKNIFNLMSFFFVKPYHLARSGVVLMDNVFLPMAYIRIKGSVKVIQLWHGTGTIKKFGQDVNRGRLKILERRANANITHLIVNNEQVGQLYAKIFSVGIDKVYPLGLPKTDDILYRIWRMDREGINRDKDIIYDKYNLPNDKKLILYAPTFRDSDISSNVIINKLEKLVENLPKDYILGLRLHPFVAEKTQKKNIENVYDLSGEKSLTTLIMASDLLITDYSSIVFEYCITEKPIIFFAYDLDDFSDNGRGFYENYSTYVPGTLASTSQEVIDIINKEDYSIEKIVDFNAENFPHLDGKSTRRIISIITNF